MTETQGHERMIRRTLELARRARASGNGAFGALLVRDGEILLGAENTVGGSGDPSAHAELNLVREAARHFDREALAECTLYASTEPCAMCAGAIYWAGVGAVVFGCPVEVQAELQPGTLAISCRPVLGSGARPVRVTGPVLGEEAAAVHWEG